VPVDGHEEHDARPVDGASGTMIAGVVHDLIASGLVLSLDGASQLPIAADGPFMFPTLEQSGAVYDVTIAMQPTGQTCEVRHGSGVADTTAVTDISVVCSIGALRITEISNCYYTGIPCWLEVTNESSAAVDLASYSLRASAVALTTNTPSLHTFALPTYAIPPGGRVVLRGKGNASLGSGRNLFSIVDGDLIPSWYSNGFLELVLVGHTADVVRMGGDSTSPTTFGWDGPTVPALIDMTYDHSLARDVTDMDTDASADWHLRAFPTPGGPNDVTSDVDDDHDGIPDQAEQPGGTYAGIDLYALGFRTGQQDILIEIDRMAPTDAGSVPQKGSLDLLVAAFLPHGIHLHPDVGNLYSATIDPANYNLGGGNDIVPFETLTQFNEIYGWKALNMDVRRQEIAHYMVYVNALPDAGGLGEEPGNDLLVAFSTGQFSTSTPENTNRLHNYQSATMMHELGHNLGLDHGGNEARNNKPNYISVMNYLYGAFGNPAIGNNEGDRYAMSACGIGNETTLVNGPETTTFRLDYSNGTSGALVETAVDESQGLRRPGSIGVDFNCDHTVAPSTYDLDRDGAIDATLTDHDDWSALELRFTRSLGGVSVLYQPGTVGEIRRVATEHNTMRPVPRGSGSRSN
jgi:hypothetical protein